MTYIYRNKRALHSTREAAPTRIRTASINVMPYVLFRINGLYGGQDGTRHQSRQTQPTRPRPRRYRHRYRAKPSSRRQKAWPPTEYERPRSDRRLGLRLSRGIPALSRGHFEVELGDGSIALFIDRQIDVVITRCGVSRNLHRGIECAAGVGHHSPQQHRLRVQHTANTWCSARLPYP